LLFALLLQLGAAGVSMDKIILDTDMIEGFDDGVAMVLLSNAPGVKLLGVATVTGNTWSAEGAAYAVRQLEIEGHKNIPVVQGTNRPLREGRMENFAEERKNFGAGTDDWAGAFGYPDPGDWQKFFKEHYGKKPSFKTDKRNAVDFIIDTIKANPGEVVFVEIGPATNLALAVQKAPEIIPLVKKVIYMGGAFFVPGNVTPSSEFNFWFDPEAAKICLRSPFKEQVIISLDVCGKVPFRKADYDAFINMLGKSALVPVFNRGYQGSSFAKDPARVSYIWDILTAAVIIDPSVIKGREKLPVDINDQFGLSYGQSMAYRTRGPAGARTADIITDIDTDKFWKMVLDKKYWNSAK